MLGDFLSLKHRPFASAEDRALRGRNPSADWSLQTAERRTVFTLKAVPALLLLLEHH